MIAQLNILVDVSLLAMLLLLAVQILRAQSPLTVVILSGLYSLTICGLFAIMDAVDVAFTEAAVGAGIATVLVISVIRFIDEPDAAIGWPSTSTISTNSRDTCSTSYSMSKESEATNSSTTGRAAS